MPTTRVCTIPPVHVHGVRRSLISSGIKCKRLAGIDSGHGHRLDVLLIASATLRRLSRNVAVLIVAVRVSEVVLIARSRDCIVVRLLAWIAVDSSESVECNSASYS